MGSDKKKINRVIAFLKKGLESLADELEGTVKGINDFLESLNKAAKDLTEMPLEEEVTESTSSAKIAAPPAGAKTVAASTLFNLLSGTAGGESKAFVAAAPTLSAAPSAPTGAPKPPGGGPPKAPTAGSPKPPAASEAGSPAAHPSRGGNLPPAPKLPPTPGSGGPPKPPAAGGSFAKRPPGAPSGAPTPPEPPGIPSAPPSAPPRAGIPSAAPATASATGGGLSSLRDEMLTELTRLKKIMRGE